MRPTSRLLYPGERFITEISLIVRFSSGGSGMYGKTATAVRNVLISPAMENSAICLRRLNGAKSRIPKHISVDTIAII